MRQGIEFCQGACRLLFNGRPCFQCHDPDPEATAGQAGGCAFALDMGNAQCALEPNTAMRPLESIRGQLGNLQCTLTSLEQLNSCSEKQPLLTQAMCNLPWSSKQL